MRQILRARPLAGNRQSAPVRSYVLYFERMARRAEEGQGRRRGLSQGAEGKVFTGAGRQLKQGLCQRRAGRFRAPESGQLKEVTGTRMIFAEHGFRNFPLDRASR
jgi:hypothetical protein